METVKEQSPGTPPAGAPPVDGQSRGEMVMQIDMAGDPRTIAEEEVRASLKGLRVVRINESGKEERTTGGTTDKPKEAQPTAQEPGREDDHPLREALFGRSPERQVLKVPAAIKEFFKVNGLGDAEEVLSQLPEIRKANQALVAENEKVKTDLAYISKLSPAALNVVQMDLEGKNWAEEYAKRPFFDWRKPAGEQDPKALHGAYGKPEEITEDDWEEYNDKDGDPRTKAFVRAKLDLYSSKYEADREKETTYVQKQAEAQTQALADRKRTTEAAMAQLISTVPGAQVHADKIQKMLHPREILGMFYEDPDKCTRLRLDAPLNAWLVSDRETVLGAKMERVQRHAKDTAAIDLLRRTPEKRGTPAHAGSGRRDEGSSIAAAREFVRKSWGL